MGVLDCMCTWDGSRVERRHVDARIHLGPLAAVSLSRAHGQATRRHVAVAANTHTGGPCRVGCMRHERLLVTRSLPSGDALHRGRQRAEGRGQRADQPGHPSLYHPCACSPYFGLSTWLPLHGCRASAPPALLLAASCCPFSISLSSECPCRKVAGSHTESVEQHIAHITIPRYPVASPAITRPPGCPCHSSLYTSPPQWLPPQSACTRPRPPLPKPAKHSHLHRPFFHRQRDRPLVTTPTPITALVYPSPTPPPPNMPTPLAPPALT